jgi:hypothetical protein
VGNGYSCKSLIINDLKVVEVAISTTFLRNGLKAVVIRMKIGKTALKIIFSSKKERSLLLFEKRVIFHPI